MLVYFSIPWGGLAKIFSKGPFSPWGIRGKSPAYTSVYATSRLRVWPKGKKLPLGRAAAFRKNLSVGRAAAEAGPAGFAFSRKPFREDRCVLWMYSENFTAAFFSLFRQTPALFPLFQKGSPGNIRKPRRLPA